MKEINDLVKRGLEAEHESGVVKLDGLQKMKFFNSTYEDFINHYDKLNDEARHTDYDECIEEALKETSPEVWNRLKGSIALKKFGV